MTCDNTVDYDTVYNEIKAQNETRAREFWESLSLMKISVTPFTPWLNA